MQTKTSEKVHDAFDSLWMYLEEDADVDAFDTIIDEPDVHCIMLDGVDNHGDMIDVMNESIVIGATLNGRDYRWIYDDGGVVWVLVGSEEEIMAKLDRIRAENPAKPTPEEPLSYEI